MGLPASPTPRFPVIDSAYLNVFECIGRCAIAAAPAAFPPPTRSILCP